MKDAAPATQTLLSVEEILKIQMAEHEIREIEDVNKLQTLAVLLWQLNLEATTQFQNTTINLYTFLESRPWWLKQLENLWLKFKK